MTVVWIVVGFLLGLTSMMIVLTGSDVLKEKRRVDRLHNPESFCFEHCKIQEKVFSQFEDPDDAIDILVNQYCVDCPVSIACDILESEDN